MMKWRRAHSSCMLFWMGVPVRSRRLRQWNPSSDFHRELCELLMAWASSRIMYCHLIFWKYATSDTTIWYDVTQTWKGACFL